MMCKGSGDSEVFVLPTTVLRPSSHRTYSAYGATRYAGWMSGDANVLKYCQGHNNLSWLIT